MNDLDEFMNLAGTDTIPTYRFYYLGENLNRLTRTNPWPKDSPEILLWQPDFETSTIRWAEKEIKEGRGKKKVLGRKELLQYFRKILPGDLAQKMVSQKK